ncbi:MAG: M20/M25/M40 family metallo-hydrolase [Phycisphaeraceae bacterium]|nr:M20/M25/M40 family metallo-hydrolase [Phycisphaeraceae bacterium]
MALSESESRVCRSIEQRRSALLDDLRLHVGLPTGSGGANSPALDETRERLCTRLKAVGAVCQLVPGDPRPDWLYTGDSNAAAGSDPRPVPPTAVCRIGDWNSGAMKNAAAADARAIMLAGHLDTVHDPRGAFRELAVSADGNRATGPGCADMKGGLVIAMAAMEALAECGALPRVSVVLNSDEETGSYHSAKAIVEEAARVAAAGGSGGGGGGGGGGGMGLALEPAMSDGGLVVERAGSAQFIIEAFGRSAHVGRDFTSGVSAVNALAVAINRVAAMPRPHEGFVLNIGPIRGGKTTNSVPDSAAAWGNARFPSHAAWLEIERRLMDLQREPGVEGATIKVRTALARPAKPLTPETQNLAILAREVSQEFGMPLPFGKTGGVCDGNLMQAAGLPTIDTMGVKGGGLHTTDEWIDLTTLVARCQMLAVVMMRVGGE